MYKAFNFEDFNIFINHIQSRKDINYFEIGRNIHNDNKESISSSIESFYRNNDESILDGAKIMEDWFPSGKYDVFLSHSHRDLNSVFEFAGFLSYHFKLKPFIDSTVWGYSDELLKEIDNKHCKFKNSENKFSYSYEKRNITTSNVYLMLMNSLNSMIFNTECLIFINTPNSVASLNQQFEKSSTYSPWIFSELNIVNKLKINKPIRIKGYRVDHSSLQENVTVNNSVNIAYTIDEQLKQLLPLNTEKILQWTEHFNPDENKHALDVLYSPLSPVYE